MTDRIEADGLEPSLLDRLLDDDRIVAMAVVRLDPERLKAAAIEAQAVWQALERRGWSRETGEEGGLTATLRVPRSEAVPARVPIGIVPGSPGLRRVLEQVADVEIRRVANTVVNTASLHLSARRLRAAILRDLGWLLNTRNLEAVMDLETAPEVRASVLNYGVPAFAGDAVAMGDVRSVARRIEQAIVSFEPRLSDVKVTPGGVPGGNASGELELQIEAQLWSFPQAQRVVLATHVDLSSGTVTVDRRG